MAEVVQLGGLEVFLNLQALEFQVGVARNIALLKDLAAQAEASAEKMNASFKAEGSQAVNAVTTANNQIVKSDQARVKAKRALLSEQEATEGEYYSTSRRRAEKEAAAIVSVDREYQQKMLRARAEINAESAKMDAEYTKGLAAQQKIREGLAKGNSAVLERQAKEDLAIRRQLQTALARADAQDEAAERASLKRREEAQAGYWNAVIKQQEAAATKQEALMRRLGGMGNLSHVGMGLAFGGAMALGAAGYVENKGEQLRLHSAENAFNAGMSAGERAAMDRFIATSNFPIPNEKVQDAFMRVHNLGFRGPDIEKIVTASAHTAVASGADIDTVGDFAARVMEKFRMGGDQTGQVFNVLHKAVANADTDVKAFTESTKAAFATAAQYGVSFTETAAALSTLTTIYKNPAVAETKLVDLLNQLHSPKEGLIKKIDALPAPYRDLLHEDIGGDALRRKPLSQILTDFDTVNAQKGYAISQFVASQRGGVAGEFLSDQKGASSEKFRQNVVDMNKALQDGTESALKPYEAHTKSLHDQLILLENDFQKMASSLDGAGFGSLIDHLRSAVQWFNSLSPAVKNATVNIAAWGGGIALVGGGLLIFSGRIIEAINLWRGLSAAFTAGAAANTTAAAAITTAAAANATAAAAITGANTAIGASEAGLSAEVVAAATRREAAETAAAAAHDSLIATMEAANVGMGASEVATSAEVIAARERTALAEAALIQAQRDQIFGFMGTEAELTAAVVAATSERDAAKAAEAAAFERANAAIGVSEAGETAAVTAATAAMNAAWVEVEAAKTAEAAVVERANLAIGVSEAGMAVAAGTGAAAVGASMTTMAATTGAATAASGGALAGLAGAAGPIAILVTAIAGLGLAWSQNLFGMRDTTATVVGQIKESFNGLGESIRNLGALGGLKEFGAHVLHNMAYNLGINMPTTSQHGGAYIGSEGASDSSGTLSAFGHPLAPVPHFGKTAGGGYASHLSEKDISDAKAAIYEAAMRHGIDPIGPTAVAMYESGLDTHNKNPHSTATGLFQILAGTAPNINREDPRQNAEFAMAEFERLGGKGLHGQEEIKAFVRNFEKPDRPGHGTHESDAEIAASMVNLRKLQYGGEYVGGTYTPGAAGSSSSISGGATIPRFEADMLQKALNHAAAQTGEQCGDAITHALQRAGIHATASGIVHGGEGRRVYAMSKDAEGHPAFPEGTILHFGKSGKANYGHFAVAHTDDRGIQRIVENVGDPRVDGSYHYSASRRLWDAAAYHGFDYQGYAPPAAALSGGVPARNLSEDMASAHAAEKASKKAKHDEDVFQRKLEAQQAASERANQALQMEAVRQQEAEKAKELREYKTLNPLSLPARGAEDLLPAEAAKLKDLIEKLKGKARLQSVARDIGTAEAVHARGLELLKSIDTLEQRGRERHAVVADIRRQIAAPTGPYDAKTFLIPGQVGPVSPEEMMAAAEGNFSGFSMKSKDSAGQKREALGQLQAWAERSREASAAVKELKLELVDLEAESKRHHSVPELLGLAGRASQDRGAIRQYEGGIAGLSEASHAYAALAHDKIAATKADETINKEFVKAVQALDNEIAKEEARVKKADFLQNSRFGKAMVHLLGGMENASSMAPSVWDAQIEKQQAAEARQINQGYGAMAQGMILAGRGGVTAENAAFLAQIDRAGQSQLMTLGQFGAFAKGAYEPEDFFSVSGGGKGKAKGKATVKTHHRVDASAVESTLREQLGLRKEHIQALEARMKDLGSQESELKAAIDKSTDAADQLGNIFLLSMTEQQKLQVSKELNAAITEAKKVKEGGGKIVDAMKEHQTWRQEHEAQAALGIGSTGSKLGDNLISTGLGYLQETFVKKGLKNLSQHGLFGNIASGAAGGPSSGLGGLLGSLAHVGLSSLGPLGNLLSTGIGFIGNLFGGGHHGQNGAPPKPYTYTQNITVHVGHINNHSNQDIKRLAEDLGWHVRQQDIVRPRPA